MSGNDDSSAPVSTGNNKSASQTRRTPSRTLRENVHTNVLGRDAGDSTRDIDYATNDNSNSSSNSDTNVASDVKSSGWWGSGLFVGSNESNNKNNNTVNQANRKRRKNNARYDGLQQSMALDEEGQYDPPPLPSTTTVDSSCSVATDSAATATVATAATREDQVREDCSTFYRGQADDPSSPFHTTRGHRGSGRTAAATNSLLRRMSVRARLSGQVDGALFMSRYERLNQVNLRSHRRSSGLRHFRGQEYNGSDNSSNNQINEETHDLFLNDNDEEDPPLYREHIPSPDNNVVMGATSLVNPHSVRSSMFFEQDGKMLMRLPRDQVRLVMDYDLEPGILSVEQWRTREVAQAASEKLAKQNAYTRLTMQRERERRYRDRERERRRRRRRRKQRAQQQRSGDHKNNDTNQEALDTDTARDPLETASGGQLPMETIPVQEEKSQTIDNEDLREEDNDSSYSSYSNDDEFYFDDDLDELPENLLPELKYVITIPDDIYRRMVGEISAKAFPPYWGFFKCCNQEQESADIKLALVILSIVMFLLFIGSLEWRTS